MSLKKKKKKISIAELKAKFLNGEIYMPLPPITCYSIVATSSVGVKLQVTSSLIFPDLLDVRVVSLLKGS